MKLKFLPAGDAMPLVPYVPLAVGQPARYIGRKHDPSTGNYPLTGKPFECDSETKEARRCVKFVRRGDCVPADKQTAEFCGVPWVAPKKGSD